MSALICFGGAQVVQDDIARYLFKTMPEKLDKPLAIAFRESDVPDGVSDVMILDLLPPASLPQIAQRIEQLAKQVEAPPVALENGWHLNLAKRSVFLDDQRIPLTDKECALLMLMLQASPEPVEKQAILEGVWRYDEQIDTRTLETHVYRLRQKLAPAGLEGNIQTVDRGYGWKCAPCA